MRVFLINPSHLSFGIGVITPRWLYVLAAATPRAYGDPVIMDEILEQVDPSKIQAGDVVGIGIHSGNALRGYEIGRIARERGAYVVFGGIHASLYPQEALDMGGAHATVNGDGDVVWAKVLADCAAGKPQSQYEGGRIDAEQFLAARWDLMPDNTYMWASVQTVRGCPKHCSFCSVWRTDGQAPRQRASDSVIGEIVELRRRGFRFIVLADDNFYPVTLADMELAAKNNDAHRLGELREKRQERFELMARLAQMPSDMVFFTQITMEVADDPEFMTAMQAARIRGALVGVESVTPEGLKSVFKEFNVAGDALAERLRIFRQYGVFVLGSFIFGLSSDNSETFAETLRLTKKAEITLAQFVMLTPYPGTVDFQRWEKTMADDPTRVAGFPLTRYWLIPQALKPKVYTKHPRMSAEEIRERTQDVWDQFYSLRVVWGRSSFLKSWRSRIGFTLLSKLYRQMFANTGIATDSARVNRSAAWARWLAKPCRKLFHGPLMPHLEVPTEPLPKLAMAPASASSGLVAISDAN